MKKIIVFICAIGFMGICSAASVEQYVRTVEKITATYAQDMRNFLRSLDPQLSQFTPAQQAKYCDIVNQYVQDSYAAIEKNRSQLPREYASMTKQNVIEQVTESKEMQMLKKYNIQCEFK
ncbi:hypothetical protein [Acinetobacter haemolyticus]|uniref:hypothetical protein n=1 Tax=Acinetobacter haemolyticus TaxID=29430 RepID=UPI0002D5AA59|nr:hypothetical protein [Acinetobacter haemolyticus]NAR52159.1 hypothetical protein [Acinetobacter haemolyticus]NAR52943.1 hypothetical protein [Acinetobacter haemolyticus]NAR60271.1 hypothetical protein [Acinetobacter haemolyticus]NAR67041.1 hypothetical protein [Acinetobacter haemolyticus]NAR70228.1 hypothetical protein [Acinetobacter haemolyticus]